MNTHQAQPAWNPVFNALVDSVFSKAMRDRAGTLAPDVNAAKPLGEYVGWDSTIEMHVTHTVGSGVPFRYDCTFHAHYSFEDAWKFIVGHVQSKRATEEIPECPHMTLEVIEAKRRVGLKQTGAILWVELVHEHPDGACVTVEREVEMDPVV